MLARAGKFLRNCGLGSAGPSTRWGFSLRCQPQFRFTRAMPLYRFRILGTFGRLIAGQFRRWEDDGAARRHAAVLAAQAGGRTVEIWRGKQQVPCGSYLHRGRLPARNKLWLRVGEARMRGSTECPECGQPDLVVVRLPVVRCLGCGCVYRFEAERTPRREPPFPNTCRWRPE